MANLNDLLEALGVNEVKKQIKELEDSGHFDTALDIAKKLKKDLEDTMSGFDFEDVKEGVNNIIKDLSSKLEKL